MRLVEIDVEIVRYVSDEPFPGLVECVLLDADGVRHSLIDKTAMFSEESLSAVSAYPRVGIVACEVESEWRDEAGRRLACINTAKPWGIEAANGVSRFVVLASALRDR